jgi:hypothetical protein
MRAVDGTNAGTVGGKDDGAVSGTAAGMVYGPLANLTRTGSVHPGKSVPLSELMMAWHPCVPNSLATVSHPAGWVGLAFHWGNSLQYA